jgi:V8-like Glu-specific endopeptidase
VPAQREMRFSMPISKILITIFVALSSYGAYADIFGRDDRNDVIRTSFKSDLGRPVAVGVLNSLWTDLGNGTSELLADYVSDYMCKDERFNNQPSVSYACSGFLVGPDLLVTAGHCSTHGVEIRNETDKYCEAYTWMFDYRADSDISKVENKNIYRCKEIIYAVATEDGVNSHDFALIRLDRPVLDREPLKIASKELRKNDTVTMMGFPMGLPLKFTNNARVFEPSVGRSFLTNLDAFSGNSGSPVFNARDEVVGVLVAGNPGVSTYTDPKLRCERFNRCDENGRNCKAHQADQQGEGFPYTYSQVQSISYYLDIINNNL